MSYARWFQMALVSTLLSWTAIGEDVSGWLGSKTTPWDWKGDKRDLKDIPQYVFDHAPLVYLYSGERFWPCDVNEHLEHMTVYTNDTKEDRVPTFDTLGELNQLDGGLGRWVYLKSDVDIDLWSDKNIKNLPAWLIGEHNIPKPQEDNEVYVMSEAHSGELSDSGGEYGDDDRDAWYKAGSTTTVPLENLPPARNEKRTHRPISGPSPGGRSTAPAILIVADKGEGVVDAFWFYFYSYNLGNGVFTFRFGNHVGDWEHSMVRFYNGVPKAVYLSEHAGGKAYTYRSVEKIGKRPVIYSATGTHAMYATPGIQDYVLPFRILRDTTDRGHLWDPLLNIYTYNYNTTLATGHDRSIRSLDRQLETYTDPLANTLTPSIVTPNVPTSWFYFGGHWGDRFYSPNDRRQYQLGTEKAYVSGPVGPRFKALGRRTVCPWEDNCVIRDSIAPRNWALRIFIDYLFALGIFFIVGALVTGCWCCCKGTRRRTGKKKAEGDGNWNGNGNGNQNVGDEDMEGRRTPREEDGLLAGDDLAAESPVVGNAVRGLLRE